MTGKRWGMWGAALAVILFVVVLIIKIMPQIALIGVGSRAPDFHAVDLASARPRALADYRGKVLLVNIWATWCEPCRAEMPAIERLHHLVTDSSFRIVSVSIDKGDSGSVLAFAREYGLTFPILQNQSGDIQDIYQTTGVPESFVVDRSGIIVKKVIGAAQWDGPVNVQLIHSLLDAH
ncbi:MAG TPA: TlpA disulfide reductase family protein [Gemmatimonadales bacterium]|nr:TlpA disulfide reductase family protein [Gemmatimonadales bacterium]